MTRTLVGEFLRSEEMVNAARNCAAEGFHGLDAFTPMPVGELDRFVAERRRAPLAAIMAAAGIVGAGSMWFLQYYGAAINYPINVGGRPLDSWAAFVPSAWEICALVTIYAGFVAFLAACRLPRPYHPVFAVPNFARGSQDRFFLSLEVEDDRANVERARQILTNDGAVNITEMPA